ncbi:patatin family protein [Alkalihalophilus pseudofirmus]|uniref:Patatin family protein n=1 Tax=Alkalihalophilus pseudofirmus TaxID=79885 RepID=A0AAJ2KW90_ALKPS|nr:patatin family protein [Alkalihalophilus pseudofirmus]MDV2884200.1 patatin family protein [Alkalihalophilus pseudofirmus]WEG18213.1 patatin family protein [Alkalihalophilus pseudofirmus]
MNGVSLVLEGGGMRAVYTAGVLEALMKHEVEIPHVIGVSAGACNGSSYVSKQIDRNRKVNIDYIDRPEYLSFKNLVKTKSIFGWDFIFNTLPNELEPFDFDTFKDSPQTFTIVTTKLDTGEPYYFDKHLPKEDLLTVLKASSSIPMLAPPVTYKNDVFFDGGVADPIPIKRSIEEGHQKHVIVLTQNKGYQKTPMKFTRFAKWQFRNNPAFLQTMLTRYQRYNQTLKRIEEMEASGEAFVIRPKMPVRVSRLEKNKERLAALYNEGAEDMLSEMNKLERWLAK